tara:strand:- start:249562 stop:250431 length:870 start_codon:yes stop_codon:yes gene_type:complete
MAISFFSISLRNKESVEEVLWDITTNVIHQLGFVDCVIYRFDREKELLLQCAAYGQKNPSDTIIHNQISIPLGDGIVGSVAKNKKAELIQDTSKDPRYIVDDENRLSEICVPILIGDKLFGVIDSEHPEKHFFTEKHLYLLTIIAALCAQKIKELSSRSKNTFTPDNIYFKKLQHLMRFDKIYTNSDLSLSMAAAVLGISSGYLSSMVNAISKRSFIDYINGYRIADVKRNLHSKEYEHYTIVSVGLEAGFNSKSAFYNAFKKHTGITPSQFKENQAISAPHAIRDRSA